MRSFVLSALILIGGLSLPVALPAAEKVDLTHYAYSIYLGSGVYSVAGRDVGVLNIPLKYELLPLREGSWGVNLNLPFAIGIYDFKGLALDVEVPDQVETLTVLPGIELLRQINSRWRVAPFADLGAAKNLSGNNVTMVYGLGVKSLYEFPWRGLDMELANRFLYAGSEAKDTRMSQEFRAFDTFLTASRDLTATVDGKPLVGSLYVGNFFYSDLAFIRFNQEDFAVRVQYEIGATVAIKKPSKLWIFSNPRIGIGYRFGDELSAIRLVFGSPF